MSTHYADTCIILKIAPLSKETIGANCWWPDSNDTHDVESSVLDRVGYTLESKTTNMYTYSFITRIYLHHEGWWHQVGFKCFGNERLARLWALQEIEIPAAWRVLSRGTKGMRAPLWSRLEDTS